MTHSGWFHWSWEQSNFRCGSFIVDSLRAFQWPAVLTVMTISWMGFSFASFDAIWGFVWTLDETIITGHSAAFASWCIILDIACATMVRIQQGVVPDAHAKQKEDSLKYCKSLWHLLDV